jgi:hypothetical protein
MDEPDILVFRLRDLHVINPKVGKSKQGESRIALRARREFAVIEERCLRRRRPNVESSSVRCRGHMKKGPARRSGRLGEVVLVG